jgi:hypothetical protein
VLDKGGLESGRCWEADFLGYVGEDRVQLFYVLENCFIVSTVEIFSIRTNERRLRGSRSGTDCDFSSMMLCKFLLKMHERLRSAHRRHGGPPSSIWHLICTHLAVSLCHCTQFAHVECIGRTLSLRHAAHALIFLEICGICESPAPFIVAACITSKALLATNTPPKKRVKGGNHLRIPLRPVLRLHVRLTSSVSPL